MKTPSSPINRGSSFSSTINNLYPARPVAPEDLSAVSLADRTGACPVAPEDGTGEQSPNHNPLPDDVVISVKNVSKKFCRNLRRSMAYGIADLSKNLVGIKPDPTNLRKDEFWALQDINLELRRGEVLG